MAHRLPQLVLRIVGAVLQSTDQCLLGLTGIQNQLTLKSPVTVVEIVHPINHPGRKNKLGKMILVLKNRNKKAFTSFT